MLGAAVWNEENAAIERGLATPNGVTRSERSRSIVLCEGWLMSRFWEVDQSFKYKSRESRLLRRGERIRILGSDLGGF